MERNSVITSATEEMSFRGGRWLNGGGEGEVFDLAIGDGG